ncbi:MAG: hypothetical protein M1837_001050 [Sclerophora amabilis]|nr:MAG: hypothetical protein M1837_001050 [Sclerophora amabilis]
MAGSSDTSTTPSASVEPNKTAALDQTLGLLRSKDDISRFVGLALLKSLLDSQEALRKDDATVGRCWAAISPKFLDRLLKATESEKRSLNEAKHMVDLAVAVIHIFTILLPGSVNQDEKLISRTPCLVTALVRSSSETTTMILQILLTLASENRGAISLLGLEDLSPLIEIAPQQVLVFEVFKYAFLTAGSGADSGPDSFAKFDDIVVSLLPSFRNAEVLSLLNFLADTLPRVAPKVIASSPPWLLPLTFIVQDTILSHPSLNARKATISLSSALLHSYPTTFPSLIFGAQSRNSKSRTGQPFSYFFLNLILIDIRTTFPSLIELLHDPEYSDISRRLAAAFDIVSAFIGFLIQSLDEEDEDNSDDDPEDRSDDRQSPSKLLPPELLLKLRRDISETMSLSIEFLRDRWDIANANSNAFSETATASQKVLPSNSASSQPPPDTNTIPVSEDLLTLAAIRTLALWLREDENPALRKEAANIMDVLLELYAHSSPPASNDPQWNGFDFTTPILMSLEPIFTTKSGLNNFSSHDGFSILWTDFHQHYLPYLFTKSTSALKSGSIILQNCPYIISLLQSSLSGSGSLTSSQLSLLPTIISTVSTLPSSSPDEYQDQAVMRLELHQLTIQMLKQAPVRERKKYGAQVGHIRDLIAEEVKMEKNEGGEQDEWQGMMQELEALHI